MNKFVIRTIEVDSKIGYCLSELDKIDVNFDELLGLWFKTTAYTRYVDSFGKEEIRSESSHPEYKIILYQKPKNYINSLSWNSINMDSLKKMKTYMEITYNGHKVYIGLDISRESLEKMENYRTFKTFYDRGSLACGCAVSLDEFKVND